MNRWVYLLGVGLALVALALAVTDWALSLQPGVTEANVKRLRQGMTLEEVKAILGPHPDDDNPLASAVLGRARGLGEIVGFSWQGTPGEVVVWVGNDSRVNSVEWLSRRSEPPRLLFRLRAWLGW
jgi:hypothetical protein